MPLRGRYAAPPGGLRWERLGRIALPVNSSEILTKSLPEASRDLPELILELLGLILGFLSRVSLEKSVGPSPPPEGPMISSDRNHNDCDISHHPLLGGEKGHELPDIPEKSGHAVDALARRT